MKCGKYIAVILLLVAQFPATAQWQDVTPVIKKKPVYIISGKKLSYYTPSGEGLIYDISGYDSLYLYSRIRMDEPVSGYKVQYELDGKRYSVSLSGVKRDKKAVYNDPSIAYYPSKSKKVVIDNRKGYKTLKVNKVNKGGGVDFSLTGVKGGKTQKIRPEKYHAKAGIIRGEKHRYYNLNSKIPARLEFDKPGRLVVYTRYRMDMREPAVYSFTYRTGTGKISTKKVNGAKMSRRSRYLSRRMKERPSVYEKTIIEIRDVPVVLEFASNQPVDARFVFKPVAEKEVWQSIPVEAPGVRLKVRGKKTMRKYYRLTPESPVHFEISARKPEQVRILVRGEFTYDMFSTNDFVLELSDHDIPVKTYKLSGDKSQKLEYYDDKERVPGTLDKIYLQVQPGTHKYSLSLKDRDKTVLLKIQKKINTK